MRASDHPAWLPLRKARDAQESLRDAATVWDRYRSTKGSAFGYRYEYSEAESRLSYRAQIPTLDGAAALERLTRHAVQDARSALSNLV